ncbi:hypothetical protein DY218_20510 [Streptomyces triticagri]|uniref:Uncharacterized protein n=1 Tax=Streptomyces triticagri TaxID=2293568 RepID=A0A372M1I3_9ACTN|nr:hypothetical protein [Streptomyces triticagri]RFU84778.1 hypothetical protein DY218_20510 [Streptomyces triticagri]
MNAFIDWSTVLGVALLLAAPSLAGHLNDRRIDRQLRNAERGPAGKVRIPDPPRRDLVVPLPIVRNAPATAQNSSSNDTEPSTATWYADGRRSKKLVSS